MDESERLRELMGMPLDPVDRTVAFEMGPMMHPTPYGMVVCDDKCKAMHKGGVRVVSAEIIRAAEDAITRAVRGILEADKEA